MGRELREAWAFFLGYAGWYEPAGRAVCAMRLAKAEEWAREEDVEIEWEWDDLPWDGDEEPPDEILCYVLRLDGECVSLGGIGDPAPAYRRVVEAELAQELQERLVNKLIASVRSL